MIVMPDADMDLAACLMGGGLWFAGERCMAISRSPSPSATGGRHADRKAGAAGALAEVAPGTDPDADGTAGHKRHLDKVLVMLDRGVKKALLVVDGRGPSCRGYERTAISSGRVPVRSRGETGT